MSSLLPSCTQDVALPTSPVPSLTSATTDHVDSGERSGSVPSPPRDLVASLVSTRFIKLTWRLPVEPHGDNLTYSVFYSLDGSSRERVENTTALGELQVTIDNLIPDTKYTFRVVASNRNGLGESSAPLTVATQPEVQVPGPAPKLQAVSITPTTVTLTWERPLTGNGDIQTYKLYYSEKGKDVEQSIMVRWQPPPPGTQNGELTGYKIRYRKAGRKGDAAEIVTNQLFQLIDGLERGTEYSFRLSAITVNGSGPATEWISVETFENDLDESQVPGVPSSLHVRPLVNSIVVSWTPPENQDIVVRGYSIGYGIGSPHSQTIKVDYKQRYYSIENLDASSHYVITLKAFNNMGEGIPVYESAITRPQSAPEPSPMLPPVGVQASVISHDAVKVSWADNSLSKNQKITDSRYYTVRWKTNIPANTKYKVANTTTLTYTVTNLKPNTLYEFSVMVTKGRRSSTWSMTAHGTTLETLPTSAPKDVTVVSKEGRPRTININWQPPSEANGKITGYIIYYSTDANAEVHDWVVEPVMGNRLTHQIQELTLDTMYYFKIQARNSKGMGPLSDTVHFRTPKDKPGITGNQENHVLVIIIIVSVGAFTIISVVVGAVLCTRHSNSHQKKKRAASKSSNASHKYKSTSKDLKPPDLWIHHERLEMKSIDKSPEPNVVMTETPIPRSTHESSSSDAAHQRQNTYRGHEVEESVSTLAGRRGVRPKIMMPFDSQPPQQSVRTQLPAPELPVASSTADLQHTEVLIKEDESHCYKPPTTHVHPTHPMKSFTSLPTVTVSTHSTPSSALPCTMLMPPPVPGVKTACIGTLNRARAPMAVTVPSAPDQSETSKMLPQKESAYRTDELSEEMAHLEGLMKDLNAITTA
ncbi:hypothetical protein QTP70_005884 [Hemibagrus guttatus]|uniref:Fibronectin type-III domain-containing protein n=1 Tax=Hemibagrus guttatus TaxID=175788 RepID=A0AAE0QMQ4_9TELE|nr:hypothetical protein QTP70_005884 [Hemibagrus guttatus]